MYTEAFLTLINDWRKQWGQADLPFFYAQLARFKRGDFMAVREAQRLALKNVTNKTKLGMVVTLDTDLGFSNDLHPPNKDIVGKRMSLMAKNMILGQSSVVFTGPLFKSATINGNKINVEFEANSIGGGLMIKDVYGQTSGGTLKEFEIAGSNGIFTSATAVINPSNNTVEVAAASASPFTAKH
ncbi:sialate O-acetylesterase [Paenibacillus anseongense]|nr:sialate O-acetylesterase [Paenibacillus anseongense]